MKKTITLVAGLAALCIAGCGNTSEGMKKDSEANGERTAEQTQNVSKGLKSAGSAFGAATTLSPKIQVAIAADTRLNDPKNLITVTSTSDTVVLEGHVMTKELKDLASEVAKKAITDNQAVNKVENKLIVQP